VQSSPNELTLLLEEASKGNKTVINKIFPIVYNELRKIASKYLYKEYGERTIQTTELVHEAYIKIMGGSNISLENRSHFFGIAANAMRQLLVDFSRKRNAEKRGGQNHTRISLVEGILIFNEYEDKILDIDNALKKLFKIDEGLSKIVELRFFAGLNIEETANVLGCSSSTVKREWNLAKAWLLRELSE
jgi:RNA polymerase sigma factor (TIGR02999 family)